MHEYDKSSKWLIQHHGDSILRLGGMRGILSWRALQAELVQPRRLPDGLIEATLEGESKPDLFILEMATYPEERLSDQAVRGSMLVYLDHGVLPEVLTLVLHPKGRLRAASNLEVISRRGWTQWNVRWKVVELWTIPAVDLLAAGDVGLIPWVPLAQFDGPPKPIFQECRTRIDRDAAPDEHENLLAVTQILAGMRYNDPRLFQILGGREAMIESPVLQEFLAEQTRDAILRAKRQSILQVLGARFGMNALSVRTALDAINDDEKLDELTKQSATCPDLAGFKQEFLATELTGSDESTP
jgi:hypothetical protein